MLEVSPRGAHERVSDSLAPVPSACRWPVPSPGRPARSWLRAAVVGQRLLELVAGADLKLREDLAQVVFDRTGAEEQPGGDFRVGQADAGQPGDLGLLRGELVARIDVVLAGGLARGGQLAAGSPGESLQADRG